MIQSATFIWYVLDQPAELNFDSVVLLKQYRGRYDETPYPDVMPHMQRRRECRLTCTKQNIVLTNISDSLITQSHIVNI
jgi:predicted GNAT superfamily acetyltransferase